MECILNEYVALERRLHIRIQENFVVRFFENITQIWSFPFFVTQAKG